MTKIVKNTTASPIILTDIGLIIAASETRTIYPTEFSLWASSVDAQTNINSGAIKINDGYGDLDKVLGLKHIQDEGVPRGTGFISAATVVATANSTLNITSASRLLTIFTGTTAGQIFKLDDARNFTVGYRCEVWNTATQQVLVQNNLGTNIFVLSAYQKTWVVLQDNSTQAGTWLFEANFMSGTGTGNGPIVFGFDGNAATGRWLELATNVASDLTQATIANTKGIRALSIGVADTSATTTATLYKNGVILDTIALSAQKRNSKVNLNHILLDKDYLSAQITAGSCSRPAMFVWL
jgi:hypothetical protein